MNNLNSIKKRILLEWKSIEGFQGCSIRDDNVGEYIVVFWNSKDKEDLYKNDFEKYKARIRHEVIGNVNLLI